MRADPKATPSPGFEVVIPREDGPFGRVARPERRREGRGSTPSTSLAMALRACHPTLHNQKTTFQNEREFTAKRSGKP